MRDEHNIKTGFTSPPLKKKKKQQEVLINDVDMVDVDINDLSSTLEEMDIGVDVVDSDAEENLLKDRSKNMDKKVRDTDIRINKEELEVRKKQQEKDVWKTMEKKLKI